MSYHFRILVDELVSDSSDASNTIQSIKWKAGYLRNAADPDDNVVEVFSNHQTTLATVDALGPNFIPFSELLYHQILEWIDQYEPEGYKDALIEELAPRLEAEYLRQKLAPNEVTFPWDAYPQGL